jgi:hypothetical protein
MAMLQLPQSRCASVSHNSTKTAESAGSDNVSVEVLFSGLLSDEESMREDMVFN